MTRFMRGIKSAVGLSYLLATIVLSSCTPSSDVPVREWNLVKLHISEKRVIEEVEQDTSAMSLVREVRSHGYRFVSNIGPGFLWVIVDDDDLGSLHDGDYEFDEIMRGEERKLFKRMVWGPRMELPRGYRTCDEIVDALQRLEFNFPEIVHLESIGHTQGTGRDIYALKVSDNAAVREDEPRVLFSAAIHGNEIMGTQLCLDLIDELVDGYERIDSITRAVNGLEIWFVPVINADGYSIATTDHPMWRKNARDNDGDGRISDGDGVDLNRNFDFNFSASGSGDPSSKYYRGTAPFSESETRAMAAFVEREKFLLSITYHSAEARVYYPWRTTPHGEDAYGPEDRLLTEIAGAIAGRISCLNEEYYYEAVRNTFEDAYATNYYYGVLGTIDFMIELGKYDHLYQESKLQKIIDNNRPGAHYLLERSFGPGLTGVVTDNRTGEPVHAVVRILPSDSADITPRTTDPVTGRYFRVLLPGEYSLEIEAGGKVVERFEGVVVEDGGWTVLNLPVDRPPET